jgi:hypothetical protein
VTDPASTKTAAPEASAGPHITFDPSANDPRPDSTLYIPGPREREQGLPPISLGLKYPASHTFPSGANPTPTDPMSKHSQEGQFHYPHKSK